MSLVTRCPHCATSYKVVPDQLRLASGWVRCGQCQELFDGRVHLREVPVAAQAAAEAAPRAVMPSPTAPVQPSAGPSSVTIPAAFRADAVVKTPEPEATGPGQGAAGGAPEAEPLQPDLDDYLTALAPQDDGDPVFLPRLFLVSEFGLDADVATDPAPESPAQQPGAEPGLDVQLGADLDDFVRVASTLPDPVVDARLGHELSVEPELLDTVAPTDALFAPAAELAPASDDASAGVGIRSGFDISPGLERQTSPGPAPGGLQDPAFQPASGPLPEPTQRASPGGYRPTQEPELWAPAGPVDTPLTSDMDVAQAAHGLDWSGAPTNGDALLGARSALDATSGLLDGPEASVLDSDWDRANASQSGARTRPAPWPELDAGPASELSFVARAERRAFWQAPAMRAVLSLAVLALVLALVAQLAMHNRDWLAARYPGLTAGLNRLCQPLDCVVQPWRQADAVLIDSSSFSRAGPNSFQLVLALRNSARVPVATPALELILTDAQQRTLLRRVVLPHELQLPDTMAARSELEARSLITLAQAAQPRTVVNYRLFAFYP